jgi:hypothetical protein
MSSVTSPCGKRSGMIAITVPGIAITLPTILIKLIGITPE